MKQRLEALGLIMHGGTIVDATIIHAPRSTKNATKSRDPEMHSTKKGNQWYFGMRLHSGADAGTGYVHTITATAANVHDIAKAHELVREDDHTVYGDSGYLGVQKRTEIRENTDLSGVDYRIAKRPSQNRMTKAYKGKADRACESFSSQQGGASIPDCKEAVSCGQDAVSERTFCNTICSLRRQIS